MSQLTRRAFAGSMAAFCAQAQAPRRRPNFIILFADDMGYGDLGCYGHPQIRTPNIDRLASEGARLTSYCAVASVCTPSRVGLLTGRYPMRAKQAHNFGPDSKDGLQLSEILLPQVLKPLGYRTMAIGKWHLGHQPEYLPTSRGFDQFLGLPYSNDMIRPWVQTERPLMLYRNRDTAEVVTDQSRITQRYTAAAVKFVGEAGADPFFLYVPYAMPHLPLAVSPERRGQSPAGLYGDVIEELDWSVGEILRAVRESGQDDNTMILFLSDNGPWNNLPKRMLQQGNEWWHSGSKGPLRGAKGGSYEGGFRVPGIARWPGRIPPRQTLRELACGLDWFPTIVNAAGGKLPGDGRVYDGFDLMPMLSIGAPSPRKDFFYFRANILEGVRQGPWKFRKAMGEDIEGLPPTGAPPELYHLERDIAERYNQVEAEPALANKLAARMKEFASELGGVLAEPPGK
jgi:arylsulfatase A